MPNQYVFNNINQQYIFNNPEDDDEINNPLDDNEINNNNPIDDNILNNPENDILINPENDDGINNNNQIPISGNIPTLQNLFSNNNSLNNFIDIIENYLQNTEEDDIINFPYLIPVQQNIPIQEDVKIALEEEEFNKETEIVDFEIFPCMECPVCLENFIENDNLKKIKCNHIFHENCIKQWLCNESNKCPICRIEIGKGVPKNI